MPLTITLPHILSALADNHRTLEASGATLGDAMDDVTRQFPALRPRLIDEAGRPRPFVAYYLNNEDIRFGGGFAASIRDGDQLTIIPAVAGG
jgi:molybdopterin synthase sulfur carrier subunit